MSKRNRDKRSSTSNKFPFRLLQIWIQANAQGERCITCGSKAFCSVTSFMDIDRHIELTSMGKPDTEATDMLWIDMVSDQMRGVHTVKRVFHECQDCVFQFLSRSVGEDAATLMFIPMIVAGGRASIVVGSNITSWSHDGDAFAGMTHAHTVDELVKHFRGPVIPLNLAG